MKIKKQIAVLCAIASFMAVVGCDKAEKTGKTGSNYTALLNTVSDTSELPDWDGDELELVYWIAQGERSNVNMPAKDVVSPEIKRVTGISINENDSFGNGSGNTFSTKLGFLQMANDYPQLVVCGNVNELVSNDLVYDLTEYLPKYCPHIMEKFPKTLNGVWDEVRINGGKKGKIYGIPAMITEAGALMMNSEVTEQQYSVFSEPLESKGFVWVRDDILKKLYPNARSYEEIEELYMKNGAFTKEDLFDVPINSKEDFVNFLYSIKELGLKENGAEVFPMYMYNGIDNWYLLNNLTGYLLGKSANNDYFTFYNKETKKVEYGFRDDEFVKMLKMWSELLKDGIASKESLIDSTQMLEEKLANGLYAISYSYQNPNSIGNSKYKWRKVYLNIENNDSKYYRYTAPPNVVLPVSIFKSAVSEEELVQILMYFDYMVSDIGEKLINWGPRSAGLWEEEDGKCVFKDKALERYMVYNEITEDVQNYGIQNGMDTSLNCFMPAYVRSYRSTKAPAVVYEREINKTDAMKKFSLGMVEPDTGRIEGYSAFFTRFTSDIKEAEEAWSARKAFEDALLKVITAEDDTAFDTLYNNFLIVAEQNGYTDELLNVINEKYLKINEAYMKNMQ